jgi:hypothetical protein
LVTYQKIYQYFAFPLFFLPSHFSPFYLPFILLCIYSISTYCVL